MLKLISIVTWPLRVLVRTWVWLAVIVIANQLVAAQLTPPFDSMVTVGAWLLFAFFAVVPFVVIRRGRGWEADTFKTPRGWGWIEVISNLTPVYGDLHAHWMVHRVVLPAHEAVLDMGIVKESDVFSALMYEDRRAGITILKLLMPGRVQLDQLSRIAYESRGHFGADEVRVTQTARTNMVRFEFGPIRDNPLDGSTAVIADEVDGRWFDALPYGVDSGGNLLTLSIENQSGCVVGGVPGSGKSEGAKVIASALVHTNAAQFVVFDGKGGSDWGWLAPRASLWHTDDENLDQVADLMERLVQVMRYRARTLKSAIGQANLWNAEPSAEFPVIFTIIDECQTYFEGSAYRGNKRAQEAVARISAAATALVKKGRSVGMFTMLITQKPTSESLPTALRDNCGPRWCGRVMTREAAEAVLGALPDGTPAEVLPMAIPSRRAGGITVRDESTGALLAARFLYLPESEAELLIEESEHLRVPFDALTALPTAEAELNA